MKGPQIMNESSRKQEMKMQQFDMAFVAIGQYLGWSIDALSFKQQAGISQAEYNACLWIFIPEINTPNGSAVTHVSKTISCPFHQGKT